MNKILKLIKSLFTKNEPVSRHNKIVNSNLNINLSMFKDKNNNKM